MVEGTRVQEIKGSRVQGFNGSNKKKDCQI
jgi:hypothetical protein